MPSSARPTMVGADQIAAPLAHVALLLCALAPTVAVVDPNAKIVAVSTLSVVAGAYRSVRPASEGSGEVMTKEDAQKFPLLGSCVLLGAFLAFKFLPKNVLDVCATAYFGMLGVVAMSAILTPVVHKFAFGGRELVSYELFSVPEMKLVNGERWTAECTLAEAAAGVAALAGTAAYVRSRHWLANNALGMSSALQGIEYLTIDSVQIGSILLAGLFVYDVFWVFCTPVMVSVARSFDAPIKLLFPRVAASAFEGADRPFSMLGLGDIVVPGLYVAMILRMDNARRAAALEPRKSLTRSASKKAATASRTVRDDGKTVTTYFPAVAFGYLVGIVTTIVVMNVFDAAQPALLYIVPGVLGATFIRAALAKEVGVTWNYCEGLEEAQAERDAAEAKTKSS